MYIYSKKIIRFINDLKDIVKEVLSREVFLKVYGDRFHDTQKRCSYPIKVVVYNNKSLLGNFCPDFIELGFHECLMHATKEELRNVVRHEIAHYITFNTYGGSIQPHAPEFRAFCLSRGWGEEVYRATTCLEGGRSVCDIEESAVLRKIQKLMALASSSNKNEAEQAMIKSQQLLIKHNIESKYIGGEDEEKIILKRILKQKRDTAKMRAIAHILETFFVTTVYNRSE